MTGATIERWAAGFEDATLPKEEWTHSAHIVVALRAVRVHGAMEATTRMRDGLRRFNAAKGGPATAYHETITLAWIALLDRFLASEDHGQPLATLAASALERMGDKLYLLRFYTREVLMSDEARMRWVAPDLCSFDEGTRCEARVL
ncbi:MAG: hypothetical protein HYR85_27945 [Planctomycetes bacterium]|nr:hypothetical protein [Planctomycetota bacterium]MBI3846111.1 hypothetical protein [Planctomycetota bacterium]